MDRINFTIVLLVGLLVLIALGGGMMFVGAIISSYIMVEAGLILTVAGFIDILVLMLILFTIDY